MRGVWPRRRLPRIVDEASQQVYDPSLVDRGIVTRRGYIAYMTTAKDEAAKARVGDYPLILRARRVMGETRVDLMWRQADAERI